MAKEFSVGFLRASEGSVDIRSLSVSLSEGLNEAIEVASNDEILLENWTRGSDIQVAAEINVDLPFLLQSAGFDPALYGDTYSLSACIDWVCPSTAIKGSVGNVQVAGGVNLLSGSIPGDALALSLKVRVIITLLFNQAVAVESLAAVIPGSILWEYERLVRIEGTGPMLSTHEVSFEELGGIYQSDMWRVSIDADLDLHFSRGVRVLLNSDHPWTRKAMSEIASGKPSSATVRWQYFLAVDVRVKLLLAAIGHSFDGDLARFIDDDESLGQELASLMQLYFPEGLTSKLVSSVLVDPQVLYSKVQAVVGLDFF